MDIATPGRLAASLVTLPALTAASITLLSGPAHAESGATLTSPGCEQVRITGEVADGYFDHGNVTVSAAVDTAQQVVELTPSGTRTYAFAFVLVAPGEHQPSVHLAWIPAPGSGSSSGRDGIVADPQTIVVEPCAPGPVEGYVTQVYDDLFDRDPDPVGLADWSASLENGTPYGEVANGITYSREFRSGLIRASYSHFLGREPDAGGLEHWLAEMARGMQIQQMQAGFIASREFYLQAGSEPRQWLANLYETVLDRPAGQEEVDFWQDQLDRGADRATVASGFLYSTEHLIAVVDGYYQHLLGRGIDPAGRDTWVTAIQRGARDEQIIASIVSSTEYRDNVLRALGGQRCEDLHMTPRTDHVAADIVALRTTCAQAYELITRVDEEHDWYQGPPVFATGAFTCSAVAFEAAVLPYADYTCRSTDAVVAWRQF